MKLKTLMSRLSAWNRHRLAKRKFKRLFSENTTSDSSSINLEEWLSIPATTNPAHENKKFKCDVVVCVHNARDDVERCLESVARNTPELARLIIVDDGSSPLTADFVRDWSEQVSGIKVELIRNDQAQGYTKAANIGLRRVNDVNRTDFVILLNSDTIAPPGWAEKLMRCGMSDDKIGVVGPLSNCASWQSVPRIFDEQMDWLVNELPDGFTVDSYAEAIAACSPQRYPSVGFINGFCFAIKITCLKDVGFFDEEIFGSGYGEENDFCLRASERGWRLAVADDAFVFHAQSKSYSNERRAALKAHADAQMARKHGGPAIQRGLEMTRASRSLAYMRAQALAIGQPLPSVPVRQPSVLFLLPASTAGGGSNVVMSEARALSELGVRVAILNKAQFYADFEVAYRECPVERRYFSDEKELLAICHEFDVIIFTLFRTISWLHPFRDQFQEKKLVYYIQDFEPDFFEKYSPDWYEAWASYSLFPEAICVTKSAWNQHELANRVGLDAHILGLSYDENSFKPHCMRDPISGKTRVLAMVRPSTPRRAPELTVEILKSLHNKYQDSIQLHVFGCRQEEWNGIAGDLVDHAHFHGELRPVQVAKLMSFVDIFLDASHFQAMGLTSIEAMACGVAVVSTANGGPQEFIVDGENGSLVTEQTTSAYVNAIERFILDRELRMKISFRAMEVSRFTSDRAARKLLSCIN